MANGIGRNRTGRAPLRDAPAILLPVIQAESLANQVGEDALRELSINDAAPRPHLERREPPRNLLERKAGLPRRQQHTNDLSPLLPPGTFEFGLP